MVWRRRDRQRQGGAGLYKSTNRLCASLGAGRVENSKITETYAFVSGFLRITAVKTSKSQLSLVASFDLQPPPTKKRSFDLQPSKSRNLSFRQWLPSNYSRQNVKSTTLLQPPKTSKAQFALVTSFEIYPSSSRNLSFR